MEKILEVPTVIFAIDTGFPADEKFKSRLYDMVATDDKKVWIGGFGKELKLFDLKKTSAIQSTFLHGPLYMQVQQTTSVQ